MGEQGGLRTGWLAAFGTEGYEGEPPLLEELGGNFGHIKSKACNLFLLIFRFQFYFCSFLCEVGGFKKQILDGEENASYLAP